MGQGAVIGVMALLLTGCAGLSKDDLLRSGVAQKYCLPAGADAVAARAEQFFQQCFSDGSVTLVTPVNGIPLPLTHSLQWTLQHDISGTGHLLSLQLATVTASSYVLGAEISGTAEACGTPLRLLARNALWARHLAYLHQSLAGDAITCPPDVPGASRRAER